MASTRRGARTTKSLWLKAGSAKITIFQEEVKSKLMEENKRVVLSINYKVWINRIIEIYGHTYSSSFLVCAVGFGALAIWPVFFRKAKSSSCVLILTPAR